MYTSVFKPTLYDKNDKLENISRIKALYSLSANACTESEGNVHSVLCTRKWNDSYLGI